MSNGGLSAGTESQDFAQRFAQKMSRILPPAWAQLNRLKLNFANINIHNRIQMFSRLRKQTPYTLPSIAVLCDDYSKLRCEACSFRIEPYALFLLRICFWQQFPQTDRCDCWQRR